MPSSTVQAYLVPSELELIVARVRRQVDCHVLLAEGVAPTWNLKLHLPSHWPTHSPWTLHFLLQPPVDSPLGENPNLGDQDRASGPLSLTAGTFSKGVLTESFIGYRTDVPAALHAWKPILTWLRRSTMTGAAARSGPDSPTYFYRNVRFSSGALQAYQSGVLLKQYASNQFWFEPRPSKHIEFPKE